MAKAAAPKKEPATPDLLLGMPVDLTIPKQDIPAADGEGRVMLRFKPDVTMAFMVEGWLNGVDVEHQRDFMISHAYDDETRAALEEAYDEKNPHIGGMTLRGIAGALHRRYMQYAKDTGIARVNNFADMTPEQIEAFVRGAREADKDEGAPPEYDPEDGGPDPLSSESPE